MIINGTTPVDTSPVDTSPVDTSPVDTPLVDTSLVTRPPAPAPARRFAQFAALCLLLSWLPWTVMGLLGADIGHGPGFIAFGLAASGPSLAALVLWLRRRGERIHGTGHTTWYGLAGGLMLGGAAPTIYALVSHVNNLSALGTSVVATTVGIGGPLIVVGYTLISGPLSEEFGWRGYLQPRLRQRFGPLRTTLILGPCWGAWHLPLFLMPGTGQHQTGLLTIGGLAFFLELIPLTFIILFVTERLRGGVWAGVAAHAGFNVMDALMPSHGGTGYLIETVIMIGLAVVTALLWKVVRLPRA